jgi:hypothetical protein
MSMSDGSDLSGRWTGIFNYPAHLPPNSFEAELREVGGSLAGTVWEQDDDPEGTGGTLHAVIEGRRQGSSVAFAKMYDDLGRMPDPVLYSGILQPDGNEISGSWEIPGYWSGTFIMIRAAGIAETAEAEARAPA